MTDMIIRKSHPIIEAGYKLSLAEQRIILLSLAKLDSRDIEQSKVTLYAKDYAENFGIDERVAYTELQKASKRLYDRSIILKGENETTEFRWIESRTRYHSGEGRVSFEFSRRVLPYLFELDKKLGYTQYHLLSVSGFNSTYSIRLYELVKKLQGMQNQVIEIYEIRRMLQLEDKYPEYRELNKFVIKVALKEINDKSDLLVSVEPVKAGRKITALKFAISTKKSAETVKKEPEASREKTRKIHGVFEEIARPQVAKGSQAEGDWANKNLSKARKEMRELGIYSGSDLDNNLQAIPTEWLKVISKFAQICDRYLSRAVSDELYNRKNA